MKIPALLVFGAGYVVGTRAGRERYEEIRAFAQRVAERLEERAGTEEPAPAEV